MKLPQAIEGIHREGRTDCLVSAGVEPAFLGDVWNKVKEIGRKVIPIVKPVACAACPFIPHPIAKAACMAACSL